MTGPVQDKPQAAYLPGSARGSTGGHALLAGRTVLVVGGGQQTHGLRDAPLGIGRATSRIAAREGASVAVNDIDGDSAEQTAVECRTEVSCGPKVTAHRGDASNDEDVQSLVQDVLSEHGGIDALVINVGVAGGNRLAGTTVTEWDRVMTLNARSHFLVLKHALPHLPPGGSVVLMSSAAWLLPSSMDLPAYAASKGALAGLATYTAKEAAMRRVRVNTVVPSLIDTSLARMADLIKPDRAHTPIPLGRQGTAWEVAYATAFLLSDLASYITGQQLLLDGGLVNVP